MKCLSRIFAFLFGLIMILSEADLYSQEDSFFRTTVNEIEELQKNKQTDLLSKRIESLLSRNDKEAEACLYFIRTVIGKDVESQFQKTLELLREANQGNINHSDIGYVLKKYGDWHRANARYKEAESTYNEALKEMKIAYKDSPDHLDIAMILNCLGILYADYGNYEKAASVYEESLRIRKLVYKNNPNHFAIAVSMNNISELYKKQGQYEKAESMIVEVLEIKKNLFKDAPNHPSIAISLSNLADLYLRQGKLAEAESLFREVLKMDKINHVDNQNHNDLAISLSNLAETCRRRGRYEEAEDLLQKALKIRQNIHRNNPNHPSVAIVLNNISILYKDQKRYEEAKEMLIKALNVLRIACQDNLNHPLIITYVNNLAAIYVEQGKYEEAEQLYKDILNFQRKMNKDDPKKSNIVPVLNNLASIYSDQGRFTEAEKLNKEAIDTLRYIYKDNPNHPHIATCLDNLSHIYYRQGKLADTWRTLNEAILITEKNPVSPEKLEWLYAGRSDLHHKAKRFKEAVEDIKKAIDLARKMRNFVSQNEHDRAVLLNSSYKLFVRLVKYQYENIHDISEAWDAMEVSRIEDFRILPVSHKNKNAKKDEKSIENANSKRISFEQVQNALNDSDTLALEYMIGEEESYLLVFGKEWKKPAIFPIVIKEKGSESLNIKKGNLTHDSCNDLLLEPKNGIISLLNKPDDIMPRSIIKKQLYELWSILTVNDEVKNAVIHSKKLLLLTDGALIDLPFDKLIVEDPKTGKKSKTLSDCSTKIEYAPSASDWYLRKNRGSK